VSARVIRKDAALLTPCSFDFTFIFQRYALYAEEDEDENEI
jgi:hypothetical protein